MATARGDIWFLASCIEFYKDEKGINGQEAYDYLHRTNAVDFLINRWEGLHTTSPLYVIANIDEFIKNQPNNQNSFRF